MLCGQRLVFVAGLVRSKFLFVPSKTIAISLIASIYQTNSYIRAQKLFFFNSLKLLENAIYICMLHATMYFRLNSINYENIQGKLWLRLRGYKSWKGILVLGRAYAADIIQN